MPADTLTREEFRDTLYDALNARESRTARFYAGGGGGHDGDEERDALLAHDAAQREEIERLRAAIELAAMDELFFSEDGKPFILCNDTFAYASADGEEIDWSEIPALRDKVKAEGWPAAARWVIEKRGARPLKTVESNMSEWDRLRGEVARLTALIEEAPHAPHCAELKARAHALGGGNPCRCWKSRARREEG